MLTCSLRQAQRDNQWLFIHKYADLRQFGDKYITDRQTYVPSRTLTLTKVAIQSVAEEQCSEKKRQMDRKDLVMKVEMMIKR